MALIVFLVAGGAALALLSFFDRFARANGDEPRWVPMAGCLVFVLLGALAIWAFAHSVPVLPD